MIRLSRAACVGLCAVLAVACTLISPAFARYSNSDSIEVVFGDSSAVLEQTMADPTADAVYDFGVYDGLSQEPFTHTLCICDDAPLSGFLRFDFDAASPRGAVAVWIEPQYYTQQRDGGYVVSASDGNLQIPFELMFSSPLTATDCVVTLNVSWYPNDGTEPTLFATYLVTLAPDTVGEGDAAVLGGDTAMLTDSSVAAQVTVPADRTGVLLAQGTSLDGAFAAGTRYFTQAYPQGVTLLRDSALYVTHDGTETVLLDISDSSSVTLTAGVSDAWCDTRTLTPQAAGLTASCDETVVSASRAVTVTLNTDAADLTWRIDRYRGGALIPLTTGADLTVTPSGQTLTVEAPTGQLPAGAYRLTVTRTHLGYPVEETFVWFFIDYR